MCSYIYIIYKIHGECEEKGTILGRNYDEKCIRLAIVACGKFDQPGSWGIIYTTAVLHYSGGFDTDRKKFFYLWDSGR